MINIEWWLTLDHRIHLLTVISTKISCCAGLLPSHYSVDVVYLVMTISFNFQSPYLIHQPKKYLVKEHHTHIANKICILTFFSSNAITFNGCWCRNCKRIGLFFLSLLTAVMQWLLLCCRPHMFKSHYPHNSINFDSTHLLNSNLPNV